MSKKMNLTINNLYTISNNLKRASENSTTVVKSFSDYAAKLQTPGSLSNELVTDTVVFNKLKTVMTQLQQAASDANTITANLKQTTGELNNKNKPIGMLINDDKTAAQLGVIINNLSTSTSKLDENMEALQHNFLLRGFFRKKAKSDKRRIADSLAHVQGR
jgi:phospholipid/cholesterol/gamma-HCH transport system substrate-binding protein